jgi:hypothetical protein
MSIKFGIRGRGAKGREQGAGSGEQKMVVDIDGRGEEVGRSNLLAR